MTAIKRRRGGASVRGGIVVRNMRFDFSGVPKRWHGGDAGVTALFDAVSACFPLGEQFFNRAVKRAAARIEDPALVADAKGFIAQESVHMREHESYNRRLRDAGCNVEEMERRQAGIIDWVENDLGEDAAIGVTASMEHLTSILADQVCADERYFRNADAVMRDLWVWHSMEEAEHGHVAFDLLNAVRSGYFFRIRMMLLSTKLFTQIFLHNLKFALKADRAAGARWAGVKYMFGTPGLVRRAALPYLAWYLPGFHPSQHGALKKTARHRARFDAAANPAAD